MKRINDLDAVLSGQRDSVRKQGRMAAEKASHSAVGAGCSISKMSDVMPASYDMDYLDQFYNPAVVMGRSVAGSGVTTITADPLSAFFIPVAVAALVWDSANPSTSLDGWILGVGINGCNQLNFTNATPTVAGATTVINSQLWNPFARSCKACPVVWGMFGNQTIRNRLLTIQFANPNAVPVDFAIYIYGIGFDCCPEFVELDGSERARKPNGPPPAPVSPTGTLTTGRAPLFAR